MQAIEPTVCGIDLFGAASKQFWIGDLETLLERCPCFEHPHKQDFYMLIAVETGEGIAQIDGQRVRLGAWRVAVVKPRCISSLEIEGHLQAKVICFTEAFFSLRYNNNILCQFCFLKPDSSPYVRISEEQRSKWQSLLGLIGSEFGSWRRDSEAVLRSYLNILLCELERIYQPLGVAKSQGIRQEKLREFETLIDKHFRTKKLPSAYADMLCITANYLNKICKEATGQTAGDLIRKRVAIEAQRLLHYTNYTIYEIAEKLGFENVPYFVTFFKKQLGYTPEEFRRRQR